MQMPQAIRQQACEGLLHFAPKKALARELGISKGSVRDSAIYIEHGFFDWIDKPWRARRPELMQKAVDFRFENRPPRFTELLLISRPEHAFDAALHRAVDIADPSALSVEELAKSTHGSLARGEVNFRPIGESLVVLALTFQTKRVPFLHRIQAEFLEDRPGIFLKTRGRTVQLRQLEKICQIPMTELVREGREIGIGGQSDYVFLRRKATSHALALIKAGMI